MGGKTKKFDPEYLGNGLEFFQTALPKVGPRWALQNPPSLPGLRVTIWGSGAPNPKISFCPRITSKNVL